MAKCFYQWPIYPDNVRQMAIITHRGQEAITSLQFPRILKQLETYLGLTGTYRHYIAKYTSKAEPLQKRKTLLLKDAPSKGTARRNLSIHTILDEPSKEKLEAFATLQAEFTKAPWLAHHNPHRRLYADLNTSKEQGYRVVLFYIKAEYDHKDLTKPPPFTAVQLIMFLSRLLSTTKKNYWPTELEVSYLVWTLHKARHLFEAAPADLPPVIYTDHSGTVTITTSSSLKSANSDNLNLHLIRTSQFIQQFRVLIHHHPGIGNKIVDTLSRLPSSKPTKPRTNKGDLNSLWYNPRPPDKLDNKLTSIPDNKMIAFTTTV
ncbi:hypothetical protein N7468_007315 [Penicillium chermesinum]|uniref:Reverse transcriptase RNase H-like domain-containing protein n=1 Tax=Penicillium chermesinum TaxID=63820 RepID=A0A9W9NU42_9EURO|nr:uncharacterized protein N7468_007315 [Penicillium chermesinum]KAJ5226090.1 hypothetical protein N7468_007315 [Penicillium chermesinum]